MQKSVQLIFLISLLLINIRSSYGEFLETIFSDDSWNFEILF